ncbi:flavin reductase family protein [Actinacidiphila guanduensis]|uniref:NADH-FMN oxidoreductase RutF, flavin reductase (DIM6/NTAB) family n=1 Tax=Actinacidiphila guanduensis TaxID=310781 RepID=A0A1G9Z6T2_9ACTN|nr:flavin reductase family protein [Actinacidiphila guanduensis]SDN17278.1 NADH-FMN oxidoreductase RutF, flavin reductase (DIM6/NTAB) family [Actinacidiphila guanduensis]
MSVLPEFFNAMATVPSPVAVATTVDASGRRWGFTGSSFTSLSADPPLILICLGKGASTHAAFTTCDRFLVNVLSAGQAEVARRFATSGIDRFAAGDMSPCESQLPGLPEATARLSCTLYCVMDGGDHSIVVGRVEQATLTGEAPLVSCNRSFTRIAQEPSVV